MQVPYPGRQTLEADLGEGWRLVPYPGHRLVVARDGKVEQVPTWRTWAVAMMKRLAGR
jgi:hypothetical protein